MARRGAAIITLPEIKELQGKLLVAVQGNTTYVSAMRELAKRKAAQMEVDATQHYQAAINAIDELLEDGHSGAAASNNRLQVNAPGGKDLTVEVNWPALSKPWLKNKAFRSSPSYQPRRTRNGVRARFPRTRSYGANAFWLDERKLSAAFKAGVVGRGKASVAYRMREIKGGDFELSFEVRLDKLPARYLDRVIRRALMKGAEGVGSTGVLRGSIPVSELTKSARPRGLARGGWAEALRPTMRPIAQRLGRAMKEQFLKSLARR